MSGVASVVYVANSDSTGAGAAVGALARWLSGVYDACIFVVALSVLVCDAVVDDEGCCDDDCDDDDDADIYGRNSLVLDRRGVDRPLRSIHLAQCACLRHVLCVVGGIACCRYVPRPDLTRHGGLRGWEGFV